MPTLKRSWLPNYTPLHYTAHVPALKQSHAYTYTYTYTYTRTYTCTHATYQHAAAANATARGPLRSAQDPMKKVVTPRNTAECVYV
jgi:hypothetical protein